MAPSQVAAVVDLANAPYDDEPVSEEEPREIAAARASLAEFGLSAEEFERRGQPKPNNFPTQAKTRLEWATRPTVLRILHALALFIATSKGDSGELLTFLVRVR